MKVLLEWLNEWPIEWEMSWACYRKGLIPSESFWFTYEARCFTSYHLLFVSLDILCSYNSSFFSSILVATLATGLATMPVIAPNTPPTPFDIFVNVVFVDFISFVLNSGYSVDMVLYN